MTREEYRRYVWNDLRCFTLFPKRYGAPKGKGEAYWRKVTEGYYNTMKWIDSSDYHWRIIEYKDGRRELAYLRVLQGGLLSGMYPAIYRGFIPRRITYATFANIRKIRLAF